jgi:hypothetical protein
MLKIGTKDFKWEVNKLKDFSSDNLNLSLVFELGQAFWFASDGKKIIKMKSSAITPITQENTIDDSPRLPIRLEYHHLVFIKDFLEQYGPPYFYPEAFIDLKVEEKSIFLQEFVLSEGVFTERSRFHGFYQPQAKPIKMDEFFVERLKLPETMGVVGKAKDLKKSLKEHNKNLLSRWNEIEEERPSWDDYSAHLKFRIFENALYLGDDKNLKKSFKEGNHPDTDFVKFSIVHFEACLGVFDGKDEISIHLTTPESPMFIKGKSSIIAMMPIKQVEKPENSF